MAMDDFDPEVMRELIGNIEALSTAMGPLAMKMGQMSGSIDAAGNAVNKEGEAIKASTKYREGEAKASIMTREANNQLAEAQKHLSAGFSNLTDSAKSFSKALLSGEGQFSSYNQAIGSLGDAAFEAGKAFGPLGMAIGGAIKAITAVTQVFTEQADAQNAFVSQMYKMGGIVGQNSDNLTDLARDAGYAAEDLDKLAPVITGASKELASLGGTTGEGTNTLLGMFKAARDGQEDFYRLGYSLEELQEVQTGYLEIQRAAGINLSQQNLTQAQLAKRSLDYAKNLRMMSELTGKSAEELQKEQALAQESYANRSMSLQRTIQIQKLEEEAQLARINGDTELADRLADQAKVLSNANEQQSSFNRQLAAEFGPEMAEQMGSLFRTGAFSEATAPLAAMGLNAAELKSQFDALAESTKNMSEDERAAAQREFLNEVIVNTRELGQARIANLGVTAQFNADAAKMAGATEGVMESLTRGSMDADEELERRRGVQQGVLDAQNEGRDAQRDAAGALIAFETDVRTSADKALDALNPLTNGFDKATLALEAMTVAVGVAAAAMTMSAFSGGGGAGGMMRSVGGALKSGMSGLGRMFSSAGSTVMRAGSSVAKGGNVLRTGANFVGTGASSGALTGLARLAGPLAAVAEVGKGVYSAMEGRERAEQNLAEGKISEQEADRRKTQETSEGAGQAIGGAGGALAGAAAGAAIGSVVPVIGTAIGGIIGGIAGAWLGSEGGEAIGGAIGEAMTITPEMEEYNRANLDLVSQMGIYNENWIGASEVNMEALNLAVAEGKVTKDMVEAMIMDNDLSDEQLQQLTDLVATMPGEGVEDIMQRQADEAAAREEELAEAERQRITDEQALIAEEERRQQEALTLLAEQRAAAAETAQRDAEVARSAEEANAALAALSGQAGDAIETASESMVTAAGELTLEGAEGELGGEVGKTMTPIMAAMFPGFGALPNLFEKVSNYLAPDEGETEDEGGILDMAKKAAMSLPGVGLLTSAADGLMALFDSKPDLDTVEGRRELFAEGTDEEWAQQTGGALGGYLQHLQNELEIIGLDATTATEEQMAVIKENAKRNFLDDKYGTTIDTTKELATGMEGPSEFQDYIQSVNALGEILTTRIVESEDEDGNYKFEQFTEFANTVQGSLDRADGTRTITDVNGLESEVVTGDLATHNFVDVWNTQVMPGLNETMAMNSQQVADAIQEKEMESADEETTATETEATQVNQTNVNIEQLLAQNAQLMNMMENRLGSVVSKLDDANEIQSKILQYGRV